MLVDQSLPSFFVNAEGIVLDRHVLRLSTSWSFWAYSRSKTSRLKSCLILDIFGPNFFGRGPQILGFTLSIDRPMEVGDLRRADSKIKRRFDIVELRWTKPTENLSTCSACPWQSEWDLCDIDMLRACSDTHTQTGVGHTPELQMFALEDDDSEQ